MAKKTAKRPYCPSCRSVREPAAIQGKGYAILVCPWCKTARLDPACDNLAFADQHTAANHLVVVKDLLKSGAWMDHDGMRLPAETPSA